MELFKIKYKEEAIELVEAMEKSLLLMENDLDNRALIEEVFRNMHTLKGNSSMFGFKITADFTHHLESIYDLVRSGKMKMSRQILNVTFSALDHLSLLINNKSTLNAKEEIKHSELSEKVIKIINYFNNTAKDSDAVIQHHKAIPVTRSDLTTHHISFIPHRNFLQDGSNPLNIINELHQLGDCKVIANIGNIPPFEDCAPDSCYTSWDIYISTNADVEVLQDVFSFVEYRCDLAISHLDNSNSFPVSSAGLADLQDTDYSREQPGVVNSSIAEKNETTGARPKDKLSSIRVPSERLDKLMSLISELMTLQAKLATLTEQNPQSELQYVTENLEKISTRLRDNAFNMCLIPIENMVTPFHRLIRDLSEELNKEIEFITEGTETELDKNIIEGLSDVIMHLLRNSVDHGIEFPAQRITSGKPRHGKIILRAYCAGTNVYVEVKDDGQGMDPNKIRGKAIEKGIIGKDSILNDKEILNLVFLPGFSTAETVSSTSGRGVGMDVVKRKIADIRGQVKITSQLNTGTTILIKLPITVSVIDGLLVKINDANFVIPLSAVDRCYEVPAGQELNRFNNLIVLGGEQIPFISLIEEFDDDLKPVLPQEIVVIYFDEKKVGLIVDAVVGKFQAVLKPLGKYFQHMENISGATILGDGKIALILDTNNVTEQFLNKKNILTYQ